MKVHTRNCQLFLANPELAKLIHTRKHRASNNKFRKKIADQPPIVQDTEPVNITVKVEPILDPDVNIKIEPDYENE